MKGVQMLVMELLLFFFTLMKRWDYLESSPSHFIFAIRSSESIKTNNQLLIHFSFPVSSLYAKLK